MVLKAFAVRHMKATTVNVDTSVNEAIWARGIKSPPHKIRVKMTKDDEGNVTIIMAEVETKSEAKKEPKKEPKAKEEPKVETKIEPTAEPKVEATAEPTNEAEKKE